MKRYIKNSFSPEDNPTDAARSTIDMVNSDLTSIHNIILKYGKIVKEHPDDNSQMNKVVDDLAFVQQKLDEIMDHYRSK